MTPEAQRIAIAEACGYSDICFSNWKGFHPAISEELAKVSGGRWYSPIPDYLKDLNAIHEAEKVLNDSQQGKYALWLTGSCGRAWWAPANKRAEAFLRTIDKWEKSEVSQKSENTP